MELKDPRVSRRQALLTGAGVVGSVAALSGPLSVLASHPEDAALVRPDSKYKLPVKKIEDIMEADGTVSNGILNIELDRNDLKVIGPMDIQFRPAFELDHEFYFQAIGFERAIMNAEFTFKESETQRVLDAILKSGLKIMAQHQHFIGERPQTWHYHFRGVGHPVHLAQAAMRVVRATSTPLPQKTSKPPTTPLPAAELGKILKGDAQVSGDGVVSVTVLRRGKLTLGGIHISPELNVSTTVNFEPLNNAGTLAAVSPDYSLTSGEVVPVLRAGREEGFQVHCLYNQETAEHPQLFFSHQIAKGNPIELAHRVRKVLNHTNVVGSPVHHHHKGNGDGDD